jgi:hypothetical protein
MLISELIDKLLAVKHDRGDIPVKLLSSDQQRSEDIWDLKLENSDWEYDIGQEEEYVLLSKQYE